MTSITIDPERIRTIPDPQEPVPVVNWPTVLLLVGSILFEFVTGVLNIQYDYVFGFSFYAGHYVGAWVFIGAFVGRRILDRMSDRTFVLALELLVMGLGVLFLVHTPR